MAESALVVLSPDYYKWREHGAAGVAAIPNTGACRYNTPLFPSALPRLASAPPGARNFTSAR
jgi:hypothetical protein